MSKNSSTRGGFDHSWELVNTTILSATGVLHLNFQFGRPSKLDEAHATIAAMLSFGW